MIILVILIQSLVYREITQLFQGTRDPWSKTLNWYFFAIANYFFYGENIIYYFKVCSCCPLSFQKIKRPSKSTLYSPKLYSTHLRRITDSLALCFTYLVCPLDCLVRESIVLNLCWKLGFMGFVASLKKNYLQRQFSLFGWVHMTLLLIVVSSHFIVDNILEVRYFICL
jgi:phosphatidate cytidylyltransferase